MRSAPRRTRQTLARIDRIDQLGSVLKGLGYIRAKSIYAHGSDCRYRIVRALYKSTLPCTFPVEPKPCACVWPIDTHAGVLLLNLGRQMSGQEEHLVLLHYT